MNEAATRRRKPTAGLKVPAQVLLPLGGVNMAPYNPRVMSRAEMDSLKASLLKHGMVLNLVVQKRSPVYGDMVLIGGHQRVQAMRELCAAKGWAEPSEVPTTVLDVADADAKQLNVSLNKIEGEFDTYKLGQLFADVRPDMTLDDVLASGFSTDQIGEMIDLVRPLDQQADLLEQGIGDVDGFAKSITLSVEFDTAEARDAAKEMLRQLATAEKRRAGAVFHEALRAYGATHGGKTRAA